MSQENQSTASVNFTLKEAGEKVDVSVTFPDDYSSAEVAGKNAVFEVDVKEIREAKAVEIDDEFAKRMGLEDLNALKQAVREQIEKEYATMSRLRLKRALLDALAENHDFDVPKGMVDMEFKQIWVEVLRSRGEEPGST